MNTYWSALSTIFAVMATAIGALVFYQVKQIRESLKDLWATRDEDLRKCADRHIKIGEDIGRLQGKTSKNPE